MSTKVSLMRSAVLVGLGLFGLSCGSDSASSRTSIPRDQACIRAAQASCAKVFSCQPTDPVIGAIQANLGGIQTDCVKTIQQMYCSAFECQAAANYHGDRAAQCEQQFSGATCQTLSTAALAAISTGVPGFLSSFPSCSEICNSSAADAAAGN